MAETQEVEINGEKWIARGRPRYALAPSNPPALMVGQATHADTQYLLEHPVALGGPMGRYEQRLGKAHEGYWSMAGGNLVVNDGELGQAPVAGSQTPAGMSAATDAGCAFCLSDIDGEKKLYLAWGDRVWKTSFLYDWTQVAQVANARTFSLIETRVDNYAKALVWACGPEVDYQVSYDGASFETHVSGWTADLVFDNYIITPYPEMVPPHIMIRAAGGVLYATLLYPGRNMAAPDPNKWRLIGWTVKIEDWWSEHSLRFIGNLTWAPALVGRQQAPTMLDRYMSFLAGRMVYGVELTAYSTGQGAFWWLNGVPYQETEPIGPIIAGARWMEGFAIANRKTIYKWYPNEQPEPVGPFWGQDGVPSDWSGYGIRDLAADGENLLALVEQGGDVYTFRYEPRTKTWDVPLKLGTGNVVGGQGSIIVGRVGFGGGQNVGRDMEMLPTSDGTYTDWDSYPSGPRFEAVLLDDADESYVKAKAGASNQKVTFGMSDIAVPGGYSINDLRIEAKVKAAVQPYCHLKLMLRVNGVDYYSDEVSIGSVMEHKPGGVYAGDIWTNDSVHRGYIEYVRYSWHWRKNPNTGLDWTENDVNGLEVGLSQVGAPLAKCTWLRAYAVVRGTASAVTDKEVMVAGLGGLNKAFKIVNLPQQGWNPRGSSLTLATTSDSNVYKTEHMGFNRPERQKVILGVRIKGEFPTNSLIKVWYVADKAASETLLGTATADGDFLRLGSNNEGIVCRTLQLWFSCQGGAILAPLGCVVQYREVADKRLMIGLNLDLEATAHKRAPYKTPGKLVQEIIDLSANGTAFPVKVWDDAERQMILAPESGGQIGEEYLKIADGTFQVWFVEPVPAA